MERKAEDLKIIDMRPVSNFCDFFVIVSAPSTRRAHAIADNIQEGLLKKNILIRTQGREKEDAQWVLLDVFDVVVHIFYAPIREFYNLEKLWQDAPVLKLPPEKHDRKRIRRTTKPATRRSTS